jgi:hypothetical protein
VDFTGYQAFGIGEVKKKADGNVVAIKDALVTAVFGDWFYVESRDRSAGILVSKPGHSVLLDRRVDLIGALQTNTDSERYLAATSVNDTGAGSVGPVGISNYALGGSTWLGTGGYTGRQRGVTGGIGLNNIGLLVRLCGRPTYLDSGSFTLDDGSGVGVHCLMPSGAAADPLWQYVTVTGISSIERIGEELHRKLLVRSADDVQVVLP